MDDVRKTQEQGLQEAVAACRHPDRQRSRNRSCSKAARPTKRFVGDWVSHGGGNLKAFRCRFDSPTSGWKVLVDVTYEKERDSIVNIKSKIKNANI